MEITRQEFCRLLIRGLEVYLSNDVDFPHVFDYRLFNVQDYSWVLNTLYFF